MVDKQRWHVRRWRRRWSRCWRRWRRRWSRCWRRRWCSLRRFCVNRRVGQDLNRSAMAFIFIILCFKNFLSLPLHFWIAATLSFFLSSSQQQKSIFLDNLLSSNSRFTLICHWSGEKLVASEVGRFCWRPQRMDGLGGWALSRTTQRQFLFPVLQNQTDDANFFSAKRTKFEALQFFRGRKRPYYQLF